MASVADRRQAWGGGFGGWRKLTRTERADTTRRLGYDRHMLDRVISGGQTGVDQAALLAAKAAGIPTGGTAPKGWETEEGPAPWLADYGLVECDEPGYPARTRANVRDADATLWIGDQTSPGGKVTLGECRLRLKSWVVVAEGSTTPRAVAGWIASHKIRVLNVAGNRESTEPGIGRGLKASWRPCQGSPKEKAPAGEAGAEPDGTVSARREVGAERLGPIGPALPRVRHEASNGARRGAVVGLA